MSTKLWATARAGGTPGFQTPLLRAASQSGCGR